MSAWKDAESLVRALAKSATGEAAVRAFRYKNAGHRKVLEALDVKQLELLVERGVDLALLEAATWQIGKKNIDAALRLCDDAEGDGFHFEDTSWEAPKPSKLVANGLLAKAKKWDAGVAKRKAADELKAGYALVPDFIAEIHALRSGGKSEKKKRR